MQTAFCLEQTAFCLVQTAVSCAFNQLLGLFFAAITAHFKIALFILEARIHPPAGGVKRGTRTHGPYPPLNNLPQSPSQIPNKYFEKWIFIWYLQVTECRLFLYCGAGSNAVQLTNAVHYDLCLF